MKRKYDLCVFIDGHYKKIGVICENKNGGFYALVDRTFNPAGVPNPDNKSSLLIGIYTPFEDKPSEQRGASASPSGM